MVAELLPESGFVALQQLKSSDPLRTLPEIEVGYEEARWSAVLRRQRRPVVPERHPRLAAAHVGDRQVRRVAAVAERDDELSLAEPALLRGVQQRVDGNAFPLRVELGPLGYAVDVDGRRLVGEPFKLLPRPSDGPATRIAEREVPRCQRCVWSWTRGEDGKVPRLVLTRREPILLRGGAATV